MFPFLGKERDRLACMIDVSGHRRTREYIYMYLDSEGSDAHYYYLLHLYLKDSLPDRGRLLLLTSHHIT